MSLAAYDFEVTPGVGRCDLSYPFLVKSVDGRLAGLFGKGSSHFIGRSVKSFEGPPLTGTCPLDILGAAQAAALGRTVSIMSAVLKGGERTELRLTFRFESQHNDVVMEAVPACSSSFKKQIESEDMCRIGRVESLELELDITVDHSVYENEDELCQPGSPGSQPTFLSSFDC
eukprot:2680495-Rhodomonas_salina.1